MYAVLTTYYGQVRLFRTGKDSGKDCSLRKEKRIFFLFLLGSFSGKKQADDPWKIAIERILQNAQIWDQKKQNSGTTSKHSAEFSGSLTKREKEASNFGGNFGQKGMFLSKGYQTNSLCDITKSLLKNRCHSVFIIKQCPTSV